MVMMRRRTKQSTLTVINNGSETALEQSVAVLFNRCACCMANGVGKA